MCWLDAAHIRQPLEKKKKQNGPTKRTTKTCKPENDLNSNAKVNTDQVCTLDSAILLPFLLPPSQAMGVCRFLDWAN